MPAPILKMGVRFRPKFSQNGEEGAAPNSLRNVSRANGRGLCYKPPFWVHQVYISSNYRYIHMLFLFGTLAFRERTQSHAEALKFCFQVIASFWYRAVQRKPRCHFCTTVTFVKMSKTSMHHVEARGTDFTRVASFLLPETLHVHSLGTHFVCDFDDVLSTKVRLGKPKIVPFVKRFIAMVMLHWSYSVVLDRVAGFDLMQQSNSLLISTESHSRAKVAACSSCAIR